MMKVAVIIPSYNEEEALGQLFDKLVNLELKLEHAGHETNFIFVDDGSTDQTYHLLGSNCSRFKKTKIIKHEFNQNLGAALKTGIDHALDNDYLAFLDSDCTYEPTIILDLIAKIELGADLVTVSPYHPAGTVEGVPMWRLVLSFGLSSIYRFLLRSRFYTFTAMVRCVRTSCVQSLLGPRNDFSFIAYFFIRAIRAKLVIEEIPATLHIRKFGQSKINLAKTIVSHLSIIGALMLGKL